MLSQGPIIKQFQEFKIFPVRFTITFTFLCKDSHGLTVPKRADNGQSGRLQNGPITERGQDGEGQ